MSAAGRLTGTLLARQLTWCWLLQAMADQGSGGAYEISQRMTVRLLTRLWRVCSCVVHCKCASQHSLAQCSCWQSKLRSTCALAGWLAVQLSFLLVQAMLGWGATSGFQEDWTWDQAADTYALDAAMAAKLQKANPQARLVPE